MASPQDIKQLSSGFNAVGLSTSPGVVSASPNDSYLSQVRQRSFSAAKHAKPLKPFSTGDIKILLLENVNETAREIFAEQGYQVEFHKSSLPEDELIEKIKDVHAIGIRSKTKLTEKVLKHAKNLIIIGCFCIGTNQVDLEYAAKSGVAVFNSPFSNSRSVAELVIAEIITLARQLGDRSLEMHTGTWNKVSNKCWEIRGKTLGIVGYGHIGSQLSVLAEAFGMNVIYYDVLMIMALGSAKQVRTLNDLLAQADFVTLHVPENPETKNLISSPQLAAMKDGAYLINASRGTVVDIPALVEAMKLGKLAGAALDVYPQEPGKNGPNFTNELNSWATELTSLRNIILTPHIGGSTEEAQSAIGIEVGTALTKYINEGTSTGAVNFPEVALRALDLDQENSVRVLYIHQNVPGVLKTVNNILGNHNIEKQFSDSRGDIAYLMADISDVDASDIKSLYEQLEHTPYKIVTRLLY
ncbi:3-phosphoglycerate dehydrogenase [Komagataella phaffii CBS 7435]|uniref:2-oxoglutarate reductase n=2 Tax=Komagataella phaffii TaxID=460519 RepID=C4R1C8_KOMPG|nr:3-phosphoglycerate dehydrogenase, catalyzes the first step in serine and glycine biosynthesis [Komagataella phaffii GS115]AOA63044.1 GQ67_00721T0 [Komagataella phaffii]KAI0461989.1 Phosphoglycerate dehydrogenase ser3 [Komagataella kurtzmanii]CAH2448170.1 3-phosphoglycerate dehydrogenase [Komagataella phaffii CBS 7435]AOA67101.1 GQ68_00668T0 [Komagataella phaffii GS115]CAY69302.1 3-phosphoglycerate dehydrogenase, catalyzes the first step in serine and glycine biosynthesis [Komagataella phaff